MTNVFTSAVIPAPIHAVWEKIRDFNALPDWNPGVADSHIEGGLASDSVGCIRNFNLQDGGNLREQLLAFSDIAHSCTYSIVESPLPLENYRATLRLLPITDGDFTYAEWAAEFTCQASEEAGLIEAIGGGVFQGSFDSLKAHFAR
jgi:hypothetical protein